MRTIGVGRHVTRITRSHPSDDYGHSARYCLSLLGQAGEPDQASRTGSLGYAVTARVAPGQGLTSGILPGAVQSDTRGAVIGHPT